MLKKLATYFFLCLVIQLYSQQKLDIQYTDAYKKAEVYLKLLQEKYYEGDYKLHKVYSDSLYIISKENNLEKFEIKAMVNQAINLNLKAEYHEAIELYKKALILTEKAPEDAHTKTLILVNLGNTYNNVELYEKSIETMNRVLEQASTKEKSDLIKVAALNGLSKSYSYIGNDQKAMLYAQEVKEIGERIGNESIVLTSLNHISNTRYKLGEYQKAIEIAEKAFQYKAFEKNTRVKAWLLINLGVAHYKLKEYNKAEEYLQKSLSIAINKNIFEIEMKCYQQLANIYRETDNKNAFEEAEKNYNQAHANFLNSQKEAVTEDLQAEIKNKDKKISEQEKKVTQLTKQQKTILWSSVLSILGLGSLFWIYIKKYKKRKSHNTTNKDNDVIISENHEVVKEEKYKNSSLSEKDRDFYKGKILEIMEEENIYLDSDLNQTTFAKKIGLSSHHLSEILHFGFKKNFYQFVNSYRIREAKNILKSSHSKNLKILAVAFDSGFKSKTTFNRVFKEQTGLTPSEYRKNINKSGSTR